jgi:hypothetical protein
MAQKTAYAQRNLSQIRNKKGAREQSKNRFRDPISDFSCRSAAKISRLKIANVKNSYLFSND